MRIPFPERVNLSHVLIFATVLGGVQLFEGTNPFFAGCVFCFLLIAGIAFNIAGGLGYPSGAFILFNTFFTILLPTVTKAVLREPADSNLHAPIRTIEIYLLGMAMMCLAVIFSRRFRARKALIEGLLPNDGLRAAYIGCSVLSVLIIFFLIVFPSGVNGSFSSFLVQANRFPMLTFVLGVIYTIHRTNGRRSVTMPLLCMMVVLSLNGLLTFSKELFLSPFFAWAVTAALLRYRLNWVNIACFGIGLYLTVTFMVPYAQYGRDFQAPELSQTQIAAYLLTHMDEVRENYEENAAIIGHVHYFDNNLGLLSRLEVFSVDDALTDVTDRDGAFGYRPIIENFENLVPHFLWPDKPTPYYGNAYAHEIGILPDTDFTTGVSFSPSADAYHEGRMVGLLVLEPLVFMLVFLILDSVIGDVRLNPVGLLTTMLISRTASEGALSGNVLLIGQSLFTNVLAAYVCAYALPVIGSAFVRSPLLSGVFSRFPALITPTHPVTHT